MCTILRFTKRDFVWFLLLIFFAGILSFLTIHIAHSRGSDIMVRDGKIFRSLDGRGGIPLWWDGFIYGQYAGTARDCIFYNYTGAGNYLMRLQGDGTNVFTIDKSGTLVLHGLTPSRLLCTNASKVISSTLLSNWLVGTTNQVTVTDDGDGTATLSTPQDIHTGASPTFAGLDVSDGNITNVADISLDTISSDEGTSINVVLGSDAGDDFLVDTDKLVVEGDTGEVGIGIATPSTKLQIRAATTIGAVTQTGVGLDDMTAEGTFTGVAALNYDVYIDQADAAKTVDTIIQPTGALNNGSYTAITTTKVAGSGDDNLTVDVTVAGGNVTVITINVGGNGYAINDTIILSGLFGGGGGGNDDGTFDIAGVVDTFKWKDNASWDVERVEITGAPQTLNYGITITFGAVIGHTATDYWEFSTTVIQPFLVEDESGNDLVSVLNNGYVGIGITAPTNILTIHETIDNTGAWSADGNSLLGLTNGRNNDDSATILRFTNYRTGGSYPGGGYSRGGVVYEYTNVGAKERRLTLTENLGTNNTLVLYNGNTGIGTVTPNTLFEMAEESADTVATISTYHNTEATTPTLTLRKADGTEANPTAVDSGAYLGTVNFNGYDDNGWDTGAMIYAEATGNWGAAERGTDLRFKTREGAGDLISHLTIEADGDIIAPQIYSEDLNGMTFRDVQVKDDGTLGYNSSTIRKKTNIEKIKDISWFYKLRPITFEYKKRTEDGEYLEEGDGTRRYGLIAEDVEKTEPIFVFYNPDGSVEGVHYTDFVTPLIKVVQDQNTRLKKLEKVNDLQEIEINLLKKQMAEIRKRLKL